MKSVSRHWVHVLAAEAQPGTMVDVELPAWQWSGSPVRVKLLGLVFGSGALYH